MGRRWLVGILVVAGLAAVAFWLRGPIALRLMQRVVERNLAADPMDAFPDGLHVLLCGAGGPLPDLRRSGACVAIVAGRSLFIVDAGTNGARNLQRLGLRANDVKAAFLTHFHSDHIDGLGELALLRWAGSANTSPLPVFGPPGVDRVVLGFNEAYAQDAVYRVAHHGPDILTPSAAGMTAVPFEMPSGDAAEVVWDRDGVVVRSFRVDHDPVRPAVGYRFEYGGRAAVVSGDTRKSESVLENARGADLLVHEALSPRLVGVLHDAAVKAGARRAAKITSDILTYHTTPVEAAETAASAGVPALLLYHIVPPLPVPGLDVIFLEGTGAVYRGELILGSDGTQVSLPAHGKAIAVSQH